MTDLSQYSVDSSDIKKFEYSEFIDKGGIFGAVIGCLLSYLVVGAIMGGTGPFIGAGLAFVGFMIYELSPIWKVYNLNRRINRINQKEVHTPPDEIIDGFFRWKEHDKVVLCDVHSDDVVQSFYYQGVLDNGVVILTKKRSLERCDASHVHAVPPEAFEIFDFENTSLTEREEENKLERVKEGLSNSQYQQVLEETKDELDRLRSKDRNKV